MSCQIITRVLLTFLNPDKSINDNVILPSSLVFISIFQFLVQAERLKISLYHTSSQFFTLVLIMADIGYRLEENKLIFLCLEMTYRKFVL